MCDGERMYEIRSISIEIKIVVPRFCFEADQPWAVYYQVEMKVMVDCQMLQICQFDRELFFSTGLTKLREFKHFQVDQLVDEPRVF